MKILVVFGSQSDENVAKPLTQMLAPDFDVEYAVISAHRDLEKLQQKMSTWSGDAIIAGAGLAAALPGVVAAMTSVPVFGVPVAAQFGGMDSVCSIAQMPPGVPVMTCAPAHTSAIVSFLKQYKSRKDATVQHVHFVVPAGVDAAAEIAKAAPIAADNNIQITSSAVADVEAFNIYLVASPADVHADAFGLHVPMMGKQDAQTPEKYLDVLAWMNKGGVWLGVNNLRNALHSVIRLSAAPAILYAGSVKNVRGVEGVSPYTFEFSDRYSIFDWGPMPDTLSGKGEALSSMAWFFFDYLQKKTGIAHHALRRVGKNGLAVTPVSVMRPYSRVEDGKLVWDYSAYAARPENALIPLEVIFRFGVPEGSSLLQRTGDLAYCQSIGLSHAPKAGDVFATPVVEFSTKLETSDRYIPYADAQAMAGMNDAEFKALADVARETAIALKECFAGIGVELWDGKFEFAFGKNRELMLVDSIGPDELRLIKDGVHLSKEILRGAYRGSPWCSAIDNAKRLAKERGEKDWKAICVGELGQTPAALPHAKKVEAEMIYKSLAATLVRTYGGVEVFPDAWSLDEITGNMRKVA